jgi:TonB family protein
VHATQIRKTSGFATLDDACITMMLDARFLPSQNSRGERIASWVTVPIVWKVDRNIPPAIMRGYVLEVGDDYYPEAAQKLHQEGDCIVGVFVNANGVGSDVYIYQSTGSAALDAACIKAVSKAAFTPAIRNGVPTGAALRVPISWRLGKY